MNLSEIKITPLLDTLRLQKISDEEYSENIEVEEKEERD